MRAIWIRQALPRVRLTVVVAATAVFALGVRASDAQSAATGGSVALNMFALSIQQAGWQLLVSNFERVYPSITVNITYLGTTDLYQLEQTELAAGSAPDLLSTLPGCGTPISICLLARSGYLAPMVREPWVKRSIPLVTSNDKYGKGLFAFTPYVTPWGVFTNNNLFKQLGLKVPQTFSQLLDLCQKAHADGTAAVVFAGATTSLVGYELTDLAVGTVYGPDKEWPAELRAGKATFDGTPGWHQALQEFIDMNNDGCFQSAMTGTTEAAQHAEFAEGQGLMTPGTSSAYATIEGDNPQFGISFYPFPGGAAPDQTTTFLQQSNSVSINAHSSPANQAAAQEFVDFVARPKENALFDRQIGGVGQYQFLHGQLPAFTSSFASVFADHAYVINPEQTWWNPNVLLALNQSGIGLVTGQDTVNDVLQAMDAAWQQGPA